MRVLILSQCLRGGGAERCARELFEYLPEVGVETELWVGQADAQLPARAHVIRYGFERCFYPLALFPAVRDWSHFGSRRRLDSIQPGHFDVIHIHNLHGHWLSINAVKRLCQRMPVVWTLHDEWASTQGIPYDLTRVLNADQARRQARWVHPLVVCYPGRHAARWSQFLMTAMPLPSRVVSPSQYILGLTSKGETFPEERLAHVPYGVTLLDEPAITAEQSDARRRFGLPSHGPVVLLIASQLWSPFKGICLGLDTIRRLSRQVTTSNRPSILLLGRGAGRVAKAIQPFAAVTTGYADNPTDLAMAYRAADVVLHPAVADNFPFVVLEAFTCRRPVIAYRVGGLPEMIGANERGELIEPFDHAEMAARLQMLLYDGHYRDRLGAAAFDWVSVKCDMRSYLRKIVDTYQSAQCFFNSQYSS